MGLLGIPILLWNILFIFPTCFVILLLSSKIDSYRYILEKNPWSNILNVVHIVVSLRLDFSISWQLLQEIKRTWLQVDQQAGSRQLETTHPLPWPWIYVLPAFLTLEAASRIYSLERVTCCWDHLDCMCDWTQLRPLYKL